MVELEKTFLAKELPPDLATFPSKPMLDIYLPSSSDHPVLRIRHNGNSFEITKKKPVIQEDASAQTEETIPLTAKEYEELAKLKGKRIQKIRYLYKHDFHSYEIDVFQEALCGLVLVDVEFASLSEKAAFTMPSFCLADVTQELFIAGGMLCGKDYKSIEKDLARFSYKPLFLP